MPFSALMAELLDMDGEDDFLFDRRAILLPNVARPSIAVNFHLIASGEAGIADSLRTLAGRRDPMAGRPIRFGVLGNGEAGDQPLVCDRSECGSPPR